MAYNKMPSACKEPQLITLGNSVDINIDPCSCPSEIRADIVVSRFSSVRLWGQIVDCHNEPVPNTLVKLVKIVGQGDLADCIAIAETTSDCQGYYQFDICSDENAWYRVLVGSSATGKEIIVTSTSASHPSSHSMCYESSPTPYTPYASAGSYYEMDC